MSLIKDKPFWEDGNIAEWFIWYEQFKNICINNKVPFIIEDSPQDIYSPDDIDLCKPNLAIRLNYLAQKRYVGIVESMESYFLSVYDETLTSDAVYTLYRDYRIHIDDVKEERVHIPKILVDRSPEEWREIDKIPQIFPENKIISSEDTVFLSDNAKEAVVYKLVQGQSELLGDNPVNLPSYTSSEEIIKRCNLTTPSYTFNPTKVAASTIQLIYHPYDLERYKSEFSNDLKVNYEAKRSGKDIPEQTAMRLFNDHVSLANREITTVAEALRNRQFRNAMKHLSNKYEVIEANTHHICQEKMLSMTFQGIGFEKESLTAFINRFQLGLRILTIVKGITYKIDNTIKSYPERITQDANSGDLKDDEVRSIILPDGSNVQVHITESQRKEWYLKALKRNPLGIFRELISYLDHDSTRSLKEVIASTQLRYTKYISEGVTELKEQANKVIQKVPPKSQVTYGVIPKRKIETSPQSNQPHKSTKLTCRRCGVNNTHSSETCKVIGKLIDDSQKSIRPKGNDKTISTKPNKPESRVIIQDKPKNVKPNEKVKANMITVDNNFKGCTYCLTDNKPLNRCNSHTFSNCNSKPIWLSEDKMDRIYSNFKRRLSQSPSQLPSTSTNKLSDYAGGHDDPDVDYDFESELEDLEE